MDGGNCLVESRVEGKCNRRLLAIRDLQAEGARKSKQLVFAALNPQPLHIFERSGFTARIGRENIVPDVETALR